MYMIPTRYPYGSVNIDKIIKLVIWKQRFYFADKYGLWRIDESIFKILKSKGYVVENKDIMGE